MLRSANLESRQSAGCVILGGCLMLRSANLESRQSVNVYGALNIMMLRSANLESRQSSAVGVGDGIDDAPLREFGIKAKHEDGRGDREARCSAPRIWNQGKAGVSFGERERRMLRSANLESRQSRGQVGCASMVDAPLREFGIKAKPRRMEGGAACRCSAPRIWNQGKARSIVTCMTRWMLRSANLESRQSSSKRQFFSGSDAPLREFGIKAKPGCPTRDRGR